MSKGKNSGSFANGKEFLKCRRDQDLAHMKAARRILADPGAVVDTSKDSSSSADLHRQHELDENERKVEWMLEQSAKFFDPRQKEK
jgi:hypothetical protein